MKKKHIISSLALLFTVSLLAGCVEEYKTQTVEATVIEKEYDPPKTSYKTVTKDGKKTKKKVTEPEEYEVTIQYKDIEREYEDEDLYDRVREGDKIKVEFTQGLDKEGKVITESIEIVD